MSFFDWLLEQKKKYRPDVDFFPGVDVAQAMTGQKASDVYGIPTGQEGQRLITRQPGESTQITRKASAGATGSWDAPSGQVLGAATGGGG
ncbi:MAG TPA: hypothetical protein ENI23_00940, partial [bacterium]|nr:hypothetical protein [bacterium]